MYIYNFTLLIRKHRCSIAHSATEHTHYELVCDDRLGSC